jgi:anti-anti-sigma factor
MFGDRPRLCGAASLLGGSPVTFSCKTYHVGVEELADGLVVYLVGRIIGDETHLVDQRILEEAGRAGRTRLYVDCEQIGSIGSGGLAGLVRLHRVASGCGNRLVLCRVPPLLQEVFNLTKLDQIFDLRSEAAPGSEWRWADAAWSGRNEGAVPRIAQEIRETGTFDCMPILADALEDAGCTNLDILSHCRGPGAHRRGCWVLDTLLRKQ